MAWLEVKGGPRDQSGCTSGTITFQYPVRYVDLLGNASIAYYTAVWDPATNTIKDAITSGAMFVLGGAEGDPVPPRIRVIEELQFSDGTTRRQAFWARPIATDEAGLEWDYSVPEPGYNVVDGGNLQESLQAIMEAVETISSPVSVAVTSGVLANGASANVDLQTIGRKASLWAVTAHNAAGLWWIRAYSTSAQRTDDADRSHTVDPADKNACLFELLLDATITVPYVLDARVSNRDTPKVPKIYLAITNLSGASGTLNLTLEAMIEEA